MRDEKMFVTSVNVYVKEPFIEDFIKATRANHESSVKEPGNMRFDVLQSIAEPAKFLLYEAYESEEAAKAHKNTTHYKAWKEAVEPWMAAPREGTPHRVICPGERSKW